MCSLPVEKLSCHAVESHDYYCDYNIHSEIEYNLASIFDGLLDLA